MNKQDIDEQAEREAQALRKQGRRSNFNDYKTTRRAMYGKDKFDKLFIED